MPATLAAHCGRARVARARWRVGLPLLGAIGIVSACGAAGDAPTEGAPNGPKVVETEARSGTGAVQASAFPGSAASLEALGAEVLRALTRGDTAALGRLRLTEREHNEVVWPELPAAAPEVNFPVEFAWENIQMRNRRALVRILPRYRDGAAELGAVRCAGEPQVFRTFRVFTDCRVGYMTSDGQALEARLFKDVLVRGGGYKIFRYYEDAPIVAGRQ